MSILGRSPALGALAVSLLSAPGRSEPRQPTHVACVGDSITAGAGASSTAKNYPSQLQSLLGSSVKVGNFGNSGSTLLNAPWGDKPYTAQIEYTNATSFVTNAGASASAIVSVVILLGANDSKPQNWEPSGKPKNDQRFIEDYRALVDHFAGLTPKPAVYVAYPLATGNSPCCNIRGDVIAQQELPLLKQVAVEKRLPIIDLNAPTAGHPDYFGDGVHPNDGGYLKLAELVKAGLAREPAVTITSSPPGAALAAGATVALTADAGDSTVDWTSVEFFEGSSSLGKATSKPFTIPWVATAGQHSITARATDTTLATGTSAPLALSVGESGGGGASGTSGAPSSAGSANAGGASGGASGAGAPNAGTSAGAGTMAGGASAGSDGSSAAGQPVSAGGSDVSGARPSSTSPRKSEGGCGCRWAKAPRHHDAASWLGWAALGFVMARRRSR